MRAVPQLCVNGNRILTALPRDDLASVTRQLEAVHLEKGEVVYIAGDRIRYAYFPIGGLFSLLSTTETGSTVEIAMVGNEGMIGLPVILKNGTTPYEVTVQIATDAFRIKAEALEEEFHKAGALQEVVLRYLDLLIAQVSQLTLCNRFHTLEAALSRWLLTAHDRVKSESLNFTQETISQALGVPRTGVTMAAGTLQRAGLIRYSRGKIEILDRLRLQANSCECYRIIYDHIDHFLDDSNGRVAVN